MGGSRSRTGGSRRFAAVLLIAACSASLLPVRGVAADPDLRSAAQRAADLRAAVEHLRIEAAQAIEDYDAAQEQLGDLTTRSLLAQRQLAEAKEREAAHRVVAGQRARSLYISGGQLGLYSTVLEAESLADVAARLHTVRTLIAADRQAEQDDADFVAAAAQIEAELRAITENFRGVERASGAAAERINTLLAAQQRALDSADREVRDLVERQQRQADNDAARRARAQLDAAMRDALARGEQAVSPNATVLAAIYAARTQLGKPYQWGATGPDSFDCSGLTQWAYARAGVALPRTSRQQWYAGTPVPIGLIAPGDLLFWATNTADPSTIHHVAIYLGFDRGQPLMLAAPHTGAFVRVEPVQLDGFIGAIRPA